MTTPEEDNLIEVTDDDGTVIKCRLYDIIEYEDKQYAVLLEVDETKDEEDAELVLMRYVEDGEEVFFETIEDDDEFEKVQAYIESLPDDDEIEE